MTGRSPNATDSGSKKNTGRSAAVAPPDTTHSETTARTSKPVEIHPPHDGTGPRNTTTAHRKAATAYTPRMVVYTPGSQLSTSHNHTRKPINTTRGRRSRADT